MKPEEEVRQKLLLKMRMNLGFPQGMIAVERRIGKIPHLSGKRVPDRRFDIIAFAANIHPLYSVFPLLLIECKAHPIFPEDFQQVIGYNNYVLSPFIAMANGEGEILAWKEKEEYQFHQGLFPYEELIQMAKM